MNGNIVDYYGKRAKEYDRFYDKPEYRNDLLLISSELTRSCLSKNILEIACGTGYWTTTIASVAGHITATDINESVLNIARQKLSGAGNVSYALSDLFDISTDVKYDACFAGLIWSHIGTEKLFLMLDKIMSLVKPGGEVIFLDQRFVYGKSSPVVKVDCFGNTYQHRILKDGTSYTIMKNFPTEELVQSKMKFCCSEVAFRNYEYFWMAKGKKRLGAFSASAK